MRISDKKNPVKKYPIGSALILAVVLSSLLAIVGVLFVMVARVDKIATSAISENMELDYAIDTVIAEISQQLALDVPGASAANDQEYYDCPDSNNTFLAELEPFRAGSDYYWRQISDITGYLTGRNRDIKAQVVAEYDQIIDNNDLIANADADGDGVGDSKWIKLDNITSKQGKPIYAAVRIIDNGALLNANTAFKMDPTESDLTVFDIAGTSQLQINLMALAGRAGDPPTYADQNALLQARANNGVGVVPTDLLSYQKNVIWCYRDPNGPYTPFDISDELEMRYRFLLNNEEIDPRLENWGGQFRRSTLSTPVATGGEMLDTWFNRAAGSGSDDPNYAYRHITTIHSMDRIINPVGHEFNNGKMVNVNRADADLLFAAIRAGLREPNAVAADELAAQLAANIIDYRDEDIDITTFVKNGKTYYGFEAQPFISEVAFSGRTGRALLPYFAVELYNQFDVDIPLGDFLIELRKDSGEVANTIRLSPYVIAKNDRFVITNRVGFPGLSPLTGRSKIDPNLVLAEYTISGDPPRRVVSEKYNIYLLRNTPKQVYIDKQETQSSWFDWEQTSPAHRSYCRADTNWNIIYQDITSTSDANSLDTLGEANGVTGTRTNYNLSNPFGNFLTIADIGRVLTISPAGTEPNDMLGVHLAAEPPEDQLRVDLLNPVFANIFQYLTVIDPAEYGHPATETRIKGRININTAPWFVLSQLPWMQQEVAKAIVENRYTVGAFQSIGEAMRVPQMGYYANSGVDLDRWPDLTPADGAINDFEERDMIFSRISNLVTVRSDLFTAYILVRIGVDGPQRRVIAIFDRSQVATSDDKVKILALHPVPDPR